MEKIVQALITDAPDKIYTNYAKRVSALVGAPYECFYIKDYFSVIEEPQHE